MKDFRRGLSLWGLLAIIAGLFTSAGCASYKPIPPVYLHPAHSATIVIKRMPDHPQMLDSGQGGLIGAIITATSRAERMREQLAGINGDQVKSIFVDEFKQRIGEHLNLDSTNQDLRIEVSVDSWGWYVPTISFGIKVGEYQSQLVGHVLVYDIARKKKIAYAHVQIQRPLGLQPEEQSARAAVSEMARVFAAQAEEALVHSLKPDQAAPGFASQ